MQTKTDRQSETLDRLPAVLRRNVFLAQLLLFWETLWPSLWPLLGVLSLFAISALMGLWSLVPIWGKITGLACFAAAILVTLVPVFRLPVPSKEVALRHLERRSGVPHRPATAYADPLALGKADPTAIRLWDAHRKRMVERLQRLRPGWPRSRLTRSDPFAVRVPLVMALIIGIAVAGPAWRDRLLSPFSFAATTSGTPVQIDAWISPPPYTGRAPIFMTGQAAAKPDLPNGLYSVPVGSEFVMRVQGDRRVTIGMRPLNGAAQDPTSSGADFAVTAPGETIREYRAHMMAPRHVTVLDGSEIISQWQIEVVSDEPPEISFASPPEQSISGAIKLSYELNDDYGILAADALIALQDHDDQAGGGNADHEPLVSAPQFSLSLPQIRARSGRGQTYQDLTAHPWAGAAVVLTLQAEDDAGQIGTSDAIEFVLPSRTFTKPLARAIVEQRRLLVLHPKKRPLVGVALDALTIEPDKYIDDLNIYLAIRTARWRLEFAQDREALLSVVDQLWQIALHIEDGDLSDAEQELRAAQEALQRALAENAPPEEIQELMQDLRVALDRYMQALAENARSGDQSAETQADSDQQTISQDDLNRMLDNIENMARNGAQDQAQQLLSQLQDILENLRAGQSQAQSPEQQMMSQSLEELGELMNRQRQLMDETFRYDQQQNDGDRAPNEDGSNAELDRLREEQAQLQAMLDQLMDQMQQFDGPPNSNFDDAKGNMGDAVNSLGQGETGPAASEQGEALENLRAGAQSLAEQLAQSQAQAGGRQGEQNVDPMGRARASQDPDLGQNVQVPDEIDIQRAREILQELRRRLGEAHRPRLELDYFERLLRRF